MIRLDSVSHRWGDREVLHEVSLTLSEARIGVVGGNGSGKSTLARLCDGLVLPSRGRVEVDGHDTAKETAAVRRLVGFVFQDPDLQIIMPTVAEDLAFSLRPARLARSEVAARVDRCLADWGLASHRDHPAHLLSGGQKQLLAIAAVLIAVPEIVVFDEPTTLLVLRDKSRIMEVITGLDQQVVVVSHDLDLLTGFDRIIVMNQGRVVADDSPAPALAAYRRLALAR